MLSTLVGSYSTPALTSWISMTMSCDRTDLTSGRIGRSSLSGGPPLRASSPLLYPMHEDDDSSSFDALERSFPSLLSRDWTSLTFPSLEFVNL